MGKLLRSWSRDGEKGKLFDDRVAHFELCKIPEHATDMRAAANFLVANYGRQKIISMPPSTPKIAIFEEAAEALAAEFRTNCKPAESAEMGWHSRLLIQP